MSVKVTAEDVQRAILELNALEQLIQEFQARLMAMDASIIEHEKSLAFIDELIKSNEALTVLMPIGAGGLIEVTIASRDKVRINIGQGIYLDAPLERGKEIVNKRRELLERGRMELQKNLQAYLQRAELLRRFLSRVEQSIQRQQSAPKRTSQ
ncbi:MAG: prefoldin subunit alpha [Aigarchaeota archaeon]|nr:prefoldin subunit alpha [Aigarchaeota archaeon]MDW8092990.1 prefoldin subunit alpha [Nitrososphaerota archaeon]